MLIYFAIALLLSAAVLGIATAMERSAIRNRINGAKGLVFLAAFIVSALGSLVVAAIAAFVWGGLVALACLAGSALWHLGLWKLLSAALQSQIDRSLGRNAKTGA